LIFLFYFMFQAVFYAQGYIPFKGACYVTYAYRTLLAGFLFFGLGLWLLPERARRLAGGWGLGLFLAVTVLYIGVVVATRPGLALSNDRAEALRIGVTSLLKGQNPYLQRTHLQNPLSPLTASFLLALPAQLAFHRPELMSLPLLALAFGALAWQRRRAAARIPLALLALIVLLNPVLIYELAWGSDLMWGSILIMLAVFALDAGWIALSALALGLGLCTRTVYFLFVPLWALYVWRQHHAAALRWALVTAATVLVLELPLILWNPSCFFHFAPLGMTAGKLSLATPAGDNLLADAFNHLLPGGAARSTLVSGALLALAALSGWRARNISQLQLGMAVVVMAALFLMGPSFLLDYLDWVLWPLFGVLVGHAAKDRAPAS